MKDHSKSIYIYITYLILNEWLMKSFPIHTLNSFYDWKDLKNWCDYGKLIEAIKSSCKNNCKISINVLLIFKCNLS